MGTHFVVRDGAVAILVYRSMRPFMARLGNRVLILASEKCNVDTGLLRSSLGTEAIEGGTGIRVGTYVHYARWVHEGRGWVYPHPPRRFLRFTPRGSTQVVFARAVRPYKGNPFLRDAMREVVGALA